MRLSPLLLLLFAIALSSRRSLFWSPRSFARSLSLSLFFPFIVPQSSIAEKSPLVMPWRGEEHRTTAGYFYWGANFHGNARARASEKKTFFRLWFLWNPIEAATSLHRLPSSASLAPRIIFKNSLITLTAVIWDFWNIVSLTAFSISNSVLVLYNL